LWAAKGGSLRPFLRYYGGKWSLAPSYPEPRFATIIEPFAGAAGYSLRYADRRVTLVEKYPVIAGIWRYLIVWRCRRSRSKR
jgi:site-specific DNA-adenine methylase